MQRYTKKQMRGKQNNFGAKYGNGVIIKEKTKRIRNIDKELLGLEEGPNANIHRDSLWATLKKK